MKTTYDYIIVGAGIYGATFAYLAKQHGKKCLVIDKRSHIGGNIYCETIKNITVHKYGPHIFHTSSERVWKFVNQFVTFNNYVNSPIAHTTQGVFSLPFNMYTFNKIWGCSTPEEARICIEKDKPQYDNVPQNLEEQAISMVGKTIYNLLIKYYTEKQWGKKCTELPPSIIKRLPLRFTYNNNYFTDKYQGIPIEGYNTLIEKLLDGIEVQLNCDFFDNREYYNSICDKIVFSGEIDKYYDYQYGRLGYRSLKFQKEVQPISDKQGNAVVNYPNIGTSFTRITEHKHFISLTQKEIDDNPYTVLTYEYPCEFDGKNDPIYPIPTIENHERYLKYKELADKDDKVIFGGRLGSYKYMDMSPVIEQALNFWDKNETNS